MRTKAPLPEPKWYHRPESFEDALWYNAVLEVGTLTDDGEAVTYARNHLRIYSQPSWDALFMGAALLHHLNR